MLRLPRVIGFAKLFPRKGLRRWQVWIIMRGQLCLGGEGVMRVQRKLSQCVLLRNNFRQQSYATASMVMLCGNSLQIRLLFQSLVYRGK